MAKTITVKLGEQDYSVPALNLGQVEELMELWESNGELSPAARFRITLKSAEIILRRAKPPVADVKTLECSPAELLAFSASVMTMSGLAPAPLGENPPAGELAH